MRISALRLARTKVLRFRNSEAFANKLPPPPTLNGGNLPQSFRKSGALRKNAPFGLLGLALRPSVCPAVGGVGQVRQAASPVPQQSLKRKGKCTAAMPPRCGGLLPPLRLLPFAVWVGQPPQWVPLRGVRQQKTQVTYAPYVHLLGQHR